MRVVALLIGVCLASAAIAQDTSAAPGQAEAPSEGANGDDANDRGATVAGEDDGGEAVDGEDAAQYRYWTTNWSLEDIELGTLFDRLASIGVELPVDVAGTATVDFDVSVPLNGLGTAQAYRFRGSFTSPQLTVGELTFETLVATVDYADGKLTLSKLSGQLGDGSFRGDASAMVVPREQFEASLELAELNLNPIASVLSRFGVGSDDRAVRGSLSGNVEASGRVDTVADVETWEGSGNVTVSGLSVGESIPITLNAKSVELRDRRLSVPQLTVSSSQKPGLSLEATARVAFDQPQAFSIKIRGNDLPSEELAAFAVTSPERYVTGKIDLKGSMTGEALAAGGQPASWNVDLAVASPELRVGGVELGLIEHQVVVTPERFRLVPLLPSDVDAAGPEAAASMTDLTIERLEADYRIEPDTITLSRLVGRLFGGQVDGEATIARDDEGQHTVKLNWSGICPEVRLPVRVLSRRARLIGVTSGQVDWAAPADRIDRPAVHRGTATINVQDLAVGADPIGGLAVDLGIDQRGLRLTAEGELFGGNVAIQTETAVDAATRWNDLPLRLTTGEIRFAEVRTNRLVETLAGGNGRRVDGRLNGTTGVRVGGGEPLQTTSQWSLRDLSIEGRLIARRLAAEFSSSDADIQIRSLRGTYAGGQLQASGRWSLGRGRRLLNVRLVRAKGSELLLPLSDDAGDWLGGIASGRLTISASGRELLAAIRVDGAVRLREGVVFGVPIGDAHGPLRLSVRGVPLMWELDLPDVQSTIAGGRLAGGLELSSSGGARRGFNMDSNWRVTHVDFEDLLATYAGAATVGRGDLTGNLQLGGRDIRDGNDLSGNFRVRLGGTDASAVPALPAAGSLLGAASLAGVRFTEGRANGRIAAGAVRIEELWLSSNRLRVAAQGRVGINDGRMDVEAVVSTGNFEAQNAALLLAAERLALPIGTLTTINRIASDRTLVLNVAGTLGDSRVRLRPVQTAQANLRRILVRETIGLTIPGTDLFNGE